MILNIPFPLPGFPEGLNDPLLESDSPARHFYSLGAVISALLPFLFILGGIILLAILIIGGFEVMTSIGNEEKLKAGAERIKNALIGFLLLFGVYWLAQLAQVLFKIPIL